MKVSIPQLYLAYRQAKTALYFERRGVGLLEWARFEDALPSKLQALRETLKTKEWFDGVDVGKVWLVPKRVTPLETRTEGAEVVFAGVSPEKRAKQVLHLQVRCSPSPEFAIVEALFLQRYGPMLDGLLEDNVVGYRLDLRDGHLPPERRWLFQYWPPQYAKFRDEPLSMVRPLIDDKRGHAWILSVDLASFFDTVDSSFLIEPSITRPLDLTRAHRATYQRACHSLIGAHLRFRKEAASLTRLPWETGIPIGSLTSRLVANLSLRELDRVIAASPDVRCYRRYVDDLVIVGRSGSDRPPPVEKLLGSLVPLETSAGTELKLDVAKLSRPGCAFRVQKKKIRLHALAGPAGRTFVEAVKADFDKVVSQQGAFVDPDALTGDLTRHLAPTARPDESPLRVLRDADRVRLEQMSLGAGLRTLERISSLVVEDEAREHVKDVVASLRKAIDGEQDWLEHFDLLIRLVRLTSLVGDWTSLRQINRMVDRVWGEGDELRNQFGKLEVGGREVKSSIRWVALRDYLQQRRLEALCAAIAGTPDAVSLGLPTGVRLGTAVVPPEELYSSAVSLARADLRARDREEDTLSVAAASPAGRRWMRDALAADPALVCRLDEIEVFTSKPGNAPWTAAPARLFLFTRPPSYFDVARRLREELGSAAPEPNAFEALLRLVNAIRGTAYKNPVGVVEKNRDIAIAEQLHLEGQTPRLILGNLTVDDTWFEAAATRVAGSLDGAPVRSLARLRGLAKVLVEAEAAAPPRNDGHPQGLLVLPELSLPRRWYRAIGNHLAKSCRIALIGGLEYLHDLKGPFVSNQVHAVFPTGGRSVALWSWTKNFPADLEGRALAKLPTALAFLPPPPPRPRTAVRTQFGALSVLICSELIEARRVADLLGRIELLVVPAWNTDTSSYEHLVQSVGLHLNAIVAVANNGHYSDCRVWAPRSERWRRDLARLVDRDGNSIICVDLPLDSLRGFRRGVLPPPAKKGGKSVPAWKPLPPDWPAGGPAGPLGPPPAKRTV